MLAPRKPCARPGCGALVPKGYCPRCQPRATALAAQYEIHRGNSHQRGYDADWRHFRVWFLAQPENKICRDCSRKRAAHVHHIRKLRDYPHLRLDPENCRGLCHACHSARTNRGE